jgi:hypothetical protein
MRQKTIIISLFLFALCLPLGAAENSSLASDATAKELFNKVYNLVFGPQGSALSYKVNIIGIYKTEGNIVYKGKKLHYAEARYMAWEDGITAYMVDKKKRQVNIYRYDDDNKDKYLSKFKYDVNNFDFSYEKDGDYYLITAKVKNASFFGIRSVTARVYKTNLHPVSLTIKLSFFRTTVQVSNFRSGKIADSNFVFPKDRFKDYEFIDHRGEK